MAHGYGLWSIDHHHQPLAISHKRCRRKRRLTLVMDALIADVRYGFRLFRKSPVFSLVAVATLALGIGANSVIFSVVDAVVIRALPYHDPDRVIVIWEDASRAGFAKNTPAPANYLDWRRLNRSFAD